MVKLQKPWKAIDLLKHQRHFWRLLGGALGVDVEMLLHLGPLLLEVVDTMAGGI